MRDPVLAIPDAAQKDHLLATGNTGSGKTTTVRGIIEYNLWAGRRVCIVDPNDDWYGLKSTADGAKAAFAVIVFGGEHADIPIDDSMGAKIGELIATTNTPAVICLKDFSPERTTKFLTPFFETIFRLNKQVLHLVLDEAHRYIPQQPRPDQAKLIHRVTDMVTGGRSRGFKFLFVTQRPARIHKDPISMTKSFIMHEMTSSHDRKALAGWMEDAEDPKLVKEIVGSLPGMPTGEGWLWIPKMKILERKKFPKGQTFDSGAAPDDGETKSEPTKLAFVDIEAIKAMLAPKPPKSSGVPALRGVPTDAGKQTADHARIVEAVDRAVQAERRQAAKEMAALRKEFEKTLATLKRSISHLATATDGAAAVCKSVIDKFPVLPEVVAPVFAHKELSIENAFGTSVIARPEHREAQQRKNGEMRAAVDGLSKAERSILRAAAQWYGLGHNTPSNAQIAGMGGYSLTSSSFTNALGALRSRGLIDGTTVTSAGLEMVGAIDLPQSPAEMRNLLTPLMAKAELAIFSALWENPDGLTKDEISETTGYSLSSSSFTNALGRLRTLEIINRGDVVACNPWVFLQ